MIRDGYGIATGCAVSIQTSAGDNIADRAACYGDTVVFHSAGGCITADDIVRDIAVYRDGVARMCVIAVVPVFGVSGFPPLLAGSANGIYEESISDTHTGNNRLLHVAVICAAAFTAYRCIAMLFFAMFRDGPIACVWSGMLFVPDNRRRCRCLSGR